MTIQAFTPNDAEALAGIYRDAVRGIGPGAYTPEQIAAWALYPDSMEEFRERMSRGLTLIAEADGRPVAFGQLDPDDHLAFLYCATAHCRRGIGSAIYRRLEAHAATKGVRELHTEASRISRPLFERHGYVVADIEHVVRFGVEFERFRMRKAL